MIAADPDPDAAAVYAAERVLEQALDRAAAGDPVVSVLGSTVVLPDTEKRFSSEAHITTYLRWLVGRPEVAHLAADRALPQVRIDRRHRRKAICTDDGVIRLPDSRFGRRELTILHELAHHLHPVDRAADAHGPGFRRVLLRLVEVALAPSAALLLTEQLHLQGLARPG